MQKAILIIAAIVAIALLIIAVVAFSNTNSAVAGNTTPTPVPAHQVQAPHAHNDLPGCNPGGLLYEDKVCDVVIDPSLDKVIKLGQGK